MPKVIINTMEKDKGPFEIDVTEKEAAIVRSFWVAGAEVIVIGGRPWNTKYIIGVADGGNKVRSTLKIDAPKENQESIRKELDKMREFLESKGLKKKEVPAEEEKSDFEEEIEEEVIDNIKVEEKEAKEDKERQDTLDKIPF